MGNKQSKSGVEGEFKASSDKKKRSLFNSKAAPEARLGKPSSLLEAERGVPILRPERTFALAPCSERSSLVASNSSGVGQS
jgi:hypothetical protein